MIMSLPVMGSVAAFGIPALETSAFGISASGASASWPGAMAGASSTLTARSAAFSLDDPEEPAPVAGDDGGEPDDEVIAEPKKPKEPKGSNVPLAKAQLTQLRDALKAKHGVETVVKSSLLVTPASGDPIAFAVYEYSIFDECQKTSTKKECRKKLRGDREMGETNDMRCTKAWMVRAELGAKVALDEPAKVSVPCTIGRVRGLFEADVDADSKPEVVLDVVGKRETEGFREGGETYANRTVRIFRLDGTSQFTLDVSWVLIEFTPAEETSQRYGLEDTNGDGHPDLELQTVEFMGEDMTEFDGVLWPALDDPDVIHKVSTQVLVYSPSADEWVAPK